MEQKKTDFCEIVQRINENKILLPNFQRKFVWTEDEKQRKLVASVLAKMPVGSILLLKSSEDEFDAKQIGIKTSVKLADDSRKEIEYLLDGQQRMTVLSNVFSNVIFEGCKSVRDLVATSLKRRFFLKVPKWKLIREGKCKDLFGVGNLKFPYNNPSKDEPSFLTQDILEYIVSYDFNVSDEVAYNPFRESKGTELDGFCVNNADEEFYLLPLYLLIESAEDCNKSTVVLKRIMKKIAIDMKDNIMIDYQSLQEGEKKDFVKSILSSEFYSSIEGLEQDLDTFEDVLQTQAEELWRDKLLEFLKSCITNMNMNQIIVEETNRDRAIDIYENLNLGGISLNTFDLIMARVAKVYQGDFYRRIVKAMEEPTQYDINLVPDFIRGNFEKFISKVKYNATLVTFCYNEKNDDINSTYINAFLNVLSLFCSNQKYDVDKVKLESIKRNAILSIDPLLIHEFSEKVCTSLDRALFFLQTRCGIRTIKELNYDMMFVLIAYIFTNDEWFYSKECHNVLEAWYWSSIFSGEYDSDQNSRMISNLQAMIRSLESRDYTWIHKIKENVFALKNFSSKDFLLLKDAEDTGRYPKDVVKKGICQFFLAQTYTDMFSDSLTISVFMDKSDELEIHHVIPLGSMKKIGESTKELRNNKSNILNTPLNYVFITKTDNNAISALPIEVYQTKLFETALATLYFSGYKNTSTDSDIEIILSHRFDSVKGRVLKRIKELIE